jgi:hypothetical protein
MLHQAAMLIIFFIAAVPKDSQRFQQRCGKPLSIFMLSVALYSRQCSSMAASLFFYFF